MSLHTILHGGKIECDVDGCAAYYLTYSYVSLARAQATQLGWARTKLNTMPDWKSLELGSRGARKLDTCPACTAEIRHEYALQLSDAPRRAAEAKAAKEVARKIAEAAKTAKKTAERERRQAAKRLAAATKADATIAKRAALAAARATRKHARDTPLPQATAAPS